MRARVGGEQRRIASGANPRVKRYRELGRAEARHESGLAAAEGVKLVLEALSSPVEVPEVFLSDSLEGEAAAAILALAADPARPARPEVLRLPGGVFERMAHTRSPQGAAAVVRVPRADPERVVAGAGKLAVLYRPQDPGNVGAVVRSAEAAAFDAVVLAGPSCDPLNPKAVRASMGSIFRVPVPRFDSLGELLARLAVRGCRVLAADPRAPVSIYGVDLGRPLALVFGGEARGLEEAGGGLERFSLPMAGRVESLNLAQAVTAALYEVRRRELSAGTEGGRARPPAD